MSVIPVSRHWIVASLLTLACVSGCATHSVPSAPVVEPAPPVSESDGSLFIPVVRYGRYVLVELAPTVAQRDLLLQVVDVSLPPDARATVGDGLRHVLKRSGWWLCEGTPAVVELDALPLPAAHRHLGPMTLRDALLTLTGAAWELYADERARQVCFVPSGDMPDGEVGVAADVVQTFPVEGEQP